MKKIIISIVCLFIGVLPTFAQAHSYKHGDIQIGHIWGTTADAGRPAAVYVPLLNNGKTDDALVDVTTPISPKAELHDSMTENDVRKMITVNEIALASGKPVALKPGGKHIMLFDLKQPLKDGDKFPLTLHFANAGKVEVEVHVQDGASHDH
jgi:periplasmic copper chaperone A